VKTWRSTEISFKFEFKGIKKKILRVFLGIFSKHQFGTIEAPYQQISTDYVELFLSFFSVISPSETNRCPLLVGRWFSEKPHRRDVWSCPGEIEMIGSIPPEKWRCFHHVAMWWHSKRPEKQLCQKSISIWALLNAGLKQDRITGWWFHFFLFSPRKLGKVPILTYIFQGGLKPPTRNLMTRWVLLILSPFMMCLKLRQLMTWWRD